jgi:hypothetical protein
LIAFQSTHKNDLPPTSSFRRLPNWISETTRSLAKKTKTKKKQKKKQQPGAGGGNSSRSNISGVN